MYIDPEWVEKYRMEITKEAERLHSIRSAFHPEMDNAHSNWLTAIRYVWLRHNPETIERQL